MIEWGIGISNIPDRMVWVSVTFDKPSKPQLHPLPLRPADCPLHSAASTRSAIARITTISRANVSCNSSSILSTHRHVDPITMLVISGDAHCAALQQRTIDRISDFSQHKHRWVRAARNESIISNVADSIASRSTSARHSPHF